VFAVNLWIDSDSDGMPDAWEIARGLNPRDPADAALDNDGDGVSNLAEYLAGTDPNDPKSYLRITSLAAGGAEAGVEVRWGSAVNHLYSIQRTAALGTPFADVAQNLFIDRSATNSSAYFYRLKVE